MKTLIFKIENSYRKNGLKKLVSHCPLFPNITKDINT